MTRLVYTPGEHQRIMRAHAFEHPRCAWWAGMGMGKTVEGLTVLDALDVVEPGPALVLGPLRVARSVWPQEARKWEHLRNLEVSPVIGTATERAKALRRDANVFTMNYDNLPWLVEHLAGKWPFAKVVADESTRLKNFRGGMRKSKEGKVYYQGAGGQRARALGRVAHRTKNFIELSGTPAPNGLKDLWGQMWFLDMGLRLGHVYEAFQQRWFAYQRKVAPDKQHELEMFPLPFAQEQIQDRLRDICITLKAEDYFDIEQPIRKTVYVDLPAKARVTYRQMEREMFTQLGGDDIEAFTAATKTMKCLQIASGHVWADVEKHRWHEVHDAKIEALESIIEEAAGAPVLVEYHWVPSKERILKAFPKFRFLDQEDSTIADWNAGKIPGLVANAASAGHGLNLQDGGNILVRFDHWWDLEQHDQILERIGPVRQMQSGHKRAVWDYSIVARDTLDELVIARRETKRTVQDLLLDAMKRRKP